MVFKRYIEVFGGVYIRVVISGLILMFIGTIIYQIGVSSIGVVLIFPLNKLFSPIPPPYSYYEIADVDLYSGVNVAGRQLIGDYEFKSQGYITISYYMDEPLYATIYVEREGSSLLFTSGKESVGARLVYGSGSFNIPVDKPGKYYLYIDVTPYTNKTLMLKITYYMLREKPEAILSKWLQALGFLIFLVGGLIVIFGHVITKRYVKASVTFMPRELREELIDLSILQLHNVNPKDEEES